MNDLHLSADWLRTVLDALRELGADVCLIDASPEKPVVELRIEITIQGKSEQLCVNLRAHGYPRDMRNYVASAAAGRSLVDGCTNVIAAPYITHTARNYLRSEGISYFDGTGSLYLKLSHMLIMVESDTRPVSTPGRKNLYKPVSSQVVHTLLIAPDREWKIASLAEMSMASPGTVHAVVSELEKIGWMDRAGAGPQTVRKLVEPGALLDDWAAHHSLDAYRFTRFHLWKQSTELLRDTVLHELEQSGIPNALTLSSGAECVAPAASSDRVLYLIVHSGYGVADVLKQAGADPVEDGGNVCILRTSARTPLMFVQTIGNCTVVSNIQLYLDLWAWPRRGKEQAAHMRTERIGF